MLANIHNVTNHKLKATTDDTAPTTRMPLIVLKPVDFFSRDEAPTDKNENVFFLDAQTQWEASSLLNWLILKDAVRNHSLFSNW